MTVVTIGDATLMLGNCLEIMPTLEGVDHVFSDPPYEDELHEAVDDQRIKRNDGGRVLDEMGFEGINATRPEAARKVVALSGGWCLLFSLAEGVRAWRDDLQAAGARWDTTLAWVKPDAQPRFNGQGAARGFECVISCWCGKGHRSWNAGGKRGIYTHLVNPRSRDGRHPTEKPLALLREIIRDFTQPGDLICDPYMGGAAIGVAALAEGRRYIGIEKKPVWFDVAVDRITAAGGSFALQPGSLFGELPKQRKPKADAPAVRRVG